MIERKHVIENAAARTRNLMADTRGAGLVEYLLLVGAIALAAMAAFDTFGGTVQGKANQLGGRVQDIGND